MNLSSPRLNRLLVLILLLSLTACGGGDNNDTAWCPELSQGAAQVYIRTETVGDATTESTVTYVVTDQTTDQITVSNGLTSTTFAVDSGRYIPVTQMRTFEYGAPVLLILYGTATYSSQTPYCPPPAVDDSYVSSVFVPSSSGRGGDYLTTTETVTAVGTETVSVPAGTYSARKVVLVKTPYLDGGSLVEQSEISRYYVPGVGVVKEVEVISATGTTITEVLNSFDPAATPLGTAANPIVVTTGQTYVDFSALSYVARVGTGALYVHFQGLLSTNSHEVTLSKLTDNADLYVYGDAAFSDLLCSSLNAGTGDESCFATTTAEGDLFIRIDGSPSSAGTDFALKAGT